jgi:threonine synthase
MMAFACLNCGRPYPALGLPYRCPACGGVYDESMPLTWRPPNARRPGIWRYLNSPISEGVAVSLGEGNTPLVSATVLGRQVYFKCEYANPTGSFKDRGSAALVASLVARGVDSAIEDSSGNAGASFAAYAARAGIRATVYVPKGNSGPKRGQIEMYGADIIAVEGPRTAAAEAARIAADGGRAYASHAYLPQNLEGYATCAYEIVEQLGESPGSVVTPAGQGGLLLGLGRGFRALLDAKVTDRMPALIGVQAAACAPLTALSEIGLPGLDFVTEGPTVAEGVRVRAPIRADAAVKMVHSSDGRFLAVDETHILPGRDALALLGFYVEPSSALIWDALVQSLPQLRDPIVAILTGSGYKTSD